MQVCWALSVTGRCTQICRALCAAQLCSLSALTAWLCWPQLADGCCRFCLQPRRHVKRWALSDELLQLLWTPNSDNSHVHAAATVAKTREGRCNDSMTMASDLVLLKFALFAVARVGCAVLLWHASCQLHSRHVSTQDGVTCLQHFAAFVCTEPPGVHYISAAVKTSAARSSPQVTAAAPALALHHTRACSPCACLQTHAQPALRSHSATKMRIPVNCCEQCGKPSPATSLTAADNVPITSHLKAHS
jgi:hypothetical protein